MLAEGHNTGAPECIKLGVYHGNKSFYEKNVGESNAEFMRRKAQVEEAQLRERERTQIEFINKQIAVVVANDAFGMGINHQHVRRVLEIGPPKLLEQLLNHFGRAGRDGERSTCTLVFLPQVNSSPNHILPDLICPMTCTDRNRT